MLNLLKDKEQEEFLLKKNRNKKFLNLCQSQKRQIFTQIKELKL